MSSCLLRTIALASALERSDKRHATFFTLSVSGTRYATFSPLSGPIKGMRHSFLRFSSEVSRATISRVIDTKPGFIGLRWIGEEGAVTATEFFTISKY